MTIDSVANFRGVAGLPVTGGGVTTDGVLYRSGALAGLSDADAETLRDLGVRTVIDLRTPAERAQAPNRLPGDARCLELPLLEGSMSPEVFHALDNDLTRLPTLADLYTDMLADGGAVFAEVARTVARADGAVLVHCTAGKDRTGVASALLLDAVGTGRDAVVANYAESGSHLSGAWAERMLAGLAHTGIPATPEILALAASSPTEAIAAVLDHLDADGGASAYLRRHGVTDADLDLLREKLVQPVAEERPAEAHRRTGPEERPAEARSRTQHHGP